MSSRHTSLRVDRLSVDVLSVGYRVVLQVVGEIDVATAPALKKAVQAVLDSAEREVWIDLTEVGFIDSLGLHVLLDAHRKLEQEHRNLVVIAPAGAVRRTLEIAGFDRILTVYEDRHSAHRHS